MCTKTKTILISITSVLLTVCCVLYYFHQERKAEVVFFEVGQGDAILINLPGNNEILIDGGPDNTILYKLGKYLPIYNRDIELMILTHPHADHVDGLVEVLSRYKIEQVMYTGVKYDSANYQNFLEQVKNIKRVEIKDIKLDQNNFLQVIYPWEDLENKDFTNQNNSSIVVKLISQSGLNFLFTGDIEKEVLENINLESLQADVLKVGHHGSDTSSSENFLQAVNPNQAIISVGKDNSFGHPSFRVIKRLERMGAEVFRTDEKGDIVIKIKD